MAEKSETENASTIDENRLYSPEPDDINEDIRDAQGDLPSNENGLPLRDEGDINSPPKQQKNKLIWHPCSRAGVLLHVHTIFTSWQKNDAQFSQIGSILLDSSGVRLPCGGRPPRKGECIH